MRFEEEAAVLRVNIWVVWILVASTSFSLLHAQVGGLHGQVSLENRKGKIESLARGDVIIYIDRLQAYIPKKQIAKDYVISTRNKQFLPQLMVIPKGATIQFPNQDPIIHNVFSVSGMNRFDAGRYSRGKGKRQTFKNPGLVRVYCNVHHGMNALVYVADNPHFATINEAGQFRLERIPPGEYQVVALHLRAGRKKTTVVIQAGQTTQVDIALAFRKKRVKKHLNKFGKPYKRSRKRY